jgi:hypothetical protein
LDTSKAAAHLGRKGGAAGTGKAKQRGGDTPEAVSAHMRQVRAQRREPQTSAKSGEWGGYTVREGLKGWVVEEWSLVQGQRSGWRALLPYSDDFPRDLDLARRRNDSPGSATEAEAILLAAHDPGVRILRRGRIVQ